VKDRARPFSKKHRKYFLPVTGGMILIGVINVAIGYWMWPKRTATTDVHEAIELHLPPPSIKLPMPDAAVPDSATIPDAVTH
jgi:hypothetical protein